MISSAFNKSTGGNDTVSTDNNVENFSVDWQNSIVNEREPRDI